MSKDEMVCAVAAGVRQLQQSFDAFDEAAAARLKLNRTDLRALDLLLADPQPLSAGGLSSALRLSPAATTTVIDRLERAGLANRIPDPHNRRRVLIAATDTARDAERDIYAPVQAAGAKALAKYSLAELAVIVDFLHTARDVQEAEVARLTRPQLSR